MTHRKSPKKEESVSIPKLILYPILVALLGSIGVFYINTNVRLTALEIDSMNSKQESKCLIEKMESVSNGVSEIRGYLKQKGGYN